VSRVNKLVGFGSVAVAVLFMFRPVSGTEDGFHTTFGSGWYALFSIPNNCGLASGRAAVPHLLIAGAIAALGVGIAFRGAGLRRLVTVVGAVIFTTLLILLLAFLASVSDDQCGG
jgi:hypothetical protein